MTNRDALEVKSNCQSFNQNALDSPQPDQYQLKVIEHSNKSMNVRTFEAPSFGDPRFDEKEIDNTILESVKGILRSQSHGLIHANILMVRLTPRAANLSKDVSRIRGLLGSQALKKMIIIVVADGGKNDNMDCFHEDFERMIDVRKTLEESKGEKFNENWYCLWDSMKAREGQQEELIRKIKLLEPYTIRDLEKAEEERRERFSKEEKETIERERRRIEREYEDQKAIQEEKMRQLKKEERKIEEEKQDLNERLIKKIQEKKKDQPGKPVFKTEADKLEQVLKMSSGIQQRKDKSTEEDKSLKERKERQNRPRRRVLCTYICKIFGRLFGVACGIGAILYLAFRWMRYHQATESINEVFY